LISDVLSCFFSPAIAAALNVSTSRAAQVYFDIEIDGKPEGERRGRERCCCFGQRAGR
jgi:hypothetical protein